MLLGIISSQQQLYLSLSLFLSWKEVSVGEVHDSEISRNTVEHQTRESAALSLHIGTLVHANQQKVFAL